MKEGQGELPQEEEPTKGKGKGKKGRGKDKGKDKGKSQQASEFQIQQQQLALRRNHDEAKGLRSEIGQLTKIVKSAVGAGDSAGSSAYSRASDGTPDGNATVEVRLRDLQLVADSLGSQSLRSLLAVRDLVPEACPAVPEREQGARQGSPGR